MRRKIGKWKWILPVCVTALGLVVLAGVVHFSIEKNHKQELCAQYPNSR